MSLPVYTKSVCLHIMKIVADDKIPHISEFFTECDDIIYLPGEKITRADLVDADILLTRTVTRVDQSLLENTAVRFVGTATTGTDHIDHDYLALKNITLATAAGANAEAVAEYVMCCVAALKKNKFLENKKTVGIIGCGRIGRLVAKFFESQEYKVFCYDPLLSEKLPFHFITFEKLISTCDIISLHTPLTKTGLHPTFHLLNETVLKKIKPGAILFNTARGDVIDQSALLSTKNIILCLDVWKNEPHISLELLHKVAIGTPHIAGYSVQAKYRATEMIYNAAAKFFEWEKLNLKKTKVDYHNFLYDPFAHTIKFRHAFQQCKTNDDIAKIFIDERKNYQLR